MRVGRRTVRTGPQPVPTYPFDRPEREAAASYLWPGPPRGRPGRGPRLSSVVARGAGAHHAVVTLRDPDGEVVEVRPAGWASALSRSPSGSCSSTGRRVLLGVNHHELDPDRGRAIPTTAPPDLALMKRHHVNAVRTAHYPHDERSTTCATSSGCT